MMTSRTTMVYDLIQSKASSNELMQGISGAFGFPYTLIADAGVIFTHYGPMLNEIRSIYGRSNVPSEVVGSLINGCKSEILADIILDKVVGQIPLIGIAANVMCARTMTWRLGLLFAMLSSRGEEISDASISRTMRLIREVFPQGNMFKFKTPSIFIVEKLLDCVENVSVETFDSKVERILDAL